jgi:outer membrane immunogenic protein
MKLDMSGCFAEKGGSMKALMRSLIAAVAGTVLTLRAFAGPESFASGKEMKQVAAPPPPLCDWTGFYVGVHIGGQFGRSQTRDLDGYQDNLNGVTRFDESGIIAGGQVGYNYQWRCLVLGVEADGGYLNLDGSGVSALDRTEADSDTHLITDSDFYATFRGRLGVAFNHWLFYATGGGIGVNYETRVLDNRDVRPAGVDLLDARKQEFDWGWTVGGGIERMIGCHWSIKAEYLYYNLEDQSFSGEATFRGEPDGTARFEGQTEGHIVRAGLNYKF